MPKRQSFPSSSSVACRLCPSTALSCLPGGPSISTTPARNAVFGRDTRLTMRLLVHVLARLAITANFTTSAAALDVRAGSPEISIPSPAICRSIRC